MRMTGAEALMRALELEGAETVFGIPGGAILPAYDPLIDAGIRHVLMRHEQGAGHAAEGYAHVTGRVGVCMATSGPGGTNLVTPIADAMMDSVPLVAITGQVARAAMGTQAFQEAPMTEIMKPITKRAWLVSEPEDLPQIVHDAFQLARSGRPGPVLIDLPKDVQQAQMDWHDPVDGDPATQPPVDLGSVNAALKLLRNSERPVFYVGGGVLRAGATAEVFELATRQQLPVVTTLMARGAFPDSHPLALGMPGMHGSYAAVTAMQRADLLFAVGARFDDRVTGRLDSFAPHAKVIHVDIDPAEIGKNRPADVALIGDARKVLTALLEALGSQGEVVHRAAWLVTLDSWRERHPFHYQQEPGGALKPQLVIERLRQATEGRAVLTAGVGQHQMWASQLWRFDRPHAWANSGGLGTMGFALPAALGAKAGRPDELVVALDGDGCFQMTSQELATSAAEDLPVLVAILNNGYLGMVKQWQELFYRGRHSQVHLGQDLPDFARLAEAYGCVGLRATTPEEVDRVLEQGIEQARRRTVVIDFRVDPEEMCFPLVPAGASNDEIMLEPPAARLTVAV
jgi:acetolactate synthase-1/2/3 large subunit